jgi:hypothetical protein
MIDIHLVRAFQLYISLCTVAGQMNVPASALSELGEVRRELQGELEKLVETRAGLEGELHALGKEDEAKQREIELVEATERQLAGQGAGAAKLAGAGARR